jgi:hypothetical protein
MTVRTANADGVLRLELTPIQRVEFPEAFSCNICCIRHTDSRNVSMPGPELIRSGPALLSQSTGQLDQR